jgi:hypothetical protein
MHQVKLHWPFAGDNHSRLGTIFTRRTSVGHHWCEDLLMGPLSFPVIAAAENRSILETNSSMQN